MTLGSKVGEWRGGRVTLAGFCDLWSFCGLLTPKGVYKYCVRLRSVFCSVCFVAVRRGSLFGLDWGAKGGICNTYTCLVLEQVFPGALGINIFFCCRTQCICYDRFLFRWWFLSP